MDGVKSWAWLLSVGLLVGCASTDNAVSSATDESPASRGLTVEAALTWPLEGEAGVDRLIAAVRQAMPVRELANPGQFASRGTTQLTDGYTLTFADFTVASRRVDIGIAEEPCFSTQLAAKATGATVSPITRDVHGVDVGQTYSVARNGVHLRFRTTADPYRCVDTIHVRRESAQ